MPFAEEQSDLGAREGTDEPGTRAYRAQAAKVKVSHRATLWGPGDHFSHIRPGCEKETRVLGKSLSDSCVCDAETQV